MMWREKIPLPLPDPPDCDLVSWVGDLGFALDAGMGATTISATELTAWANGMGVDLSPWEFGMMRRISRAYLTGFHSGKPPWEPAETKARIWAARSMREERVRRLTA